MLFASILDPVTTSRNDEKRGRVVDEQLNCLDIFLEPKLRHHVRAEHDCLHCLRRGHELRLRRRHDCQRLTSCPEAHRGARHHQHVRRHWFAVVNIYAPVGIRNLRAFEVPSLVYNSDVRRPGQVTNQVLHRSHVSLGRLRHNPSKLGHCVHDVVASGLGKVTDRACDGVVAFPVQKLPLWLLRP